MAILEIAIIILGAFLILKWAAECADYIVEKAGEDR